MRFEKAKESVYHRKYKKLDSALADIGGMTKAIMIIGFIICIPINQLNLHLKLSNTLFRYQKNNNDPRGAQDNVYGQQIIKYIETSQQQNKINVKQPNIMFQQSQKVKQNGTMAKQIVPKKPPNHKLTVDAQSNQLYSNSEKNILLLQQNQKQGGEGDQLNKWLALNSDQVDSIAFKGTESTPQNNIHKSQNKNYQQRNVLKLIQMSKLMTVQTKQYQESNNKVHDKNNKKEIENHILKKQNIVIKQAPSQVNTQIKKEDTNQSSSLDLSWTDYIKYYLFPCGKKFEVKKKQINYSIEKIYNHLDILYLVQKLLELEKIKQLLLDEDQIKLIQFLPKPLIDVTTLDVQKKEKEFLKKSQIYLNKKLQDKKKDYSVNMLRDTNDDEKMKAKEAFQALQNIIQKQNLTELDKKLILMLDSTFFEYIDNNAEYLQGLDQLNNIKIDNCSEGNIFNQNIASNQSMNSNLKINHYLPNNVHEQKQDIIQMSDSQDSVINPIEEEHQNYSEDQKSQQQLKIYQSLNFQSITQLIAPYSKRRINLENIDSQKLQSVSMQ